MQVATGVEAGEALTGHPALYLYLLTGTVAAFGGFGWLLGEREARLLEANERLATMAVTDELTGLRNLRYFRSRLTEAFAESARTGRPLAVIMLDIDRFKGVNDRFGHPVGDDVLVNTARAIASITRHGETEARVGGEEFAVLLVDSTSEQAREVAERIRQAIAEAETVLPGTGGQTIRVTVSAGVASTADVAAADEEALLRAADDALYQAKGAGRDRTMVAGDPDASPDAPD